ncbi:SDR family NAD(P)-dependent oxidoreductase [Microbacterium caowuchunii]|uniref:SDR family NAD(P)-dependent oxidoreductase n=1 Tax=Microbacterium caowuchunii TaxID=2614638 RepID=UPI001246C1CD|nr:SDR family NAD(P)-dependent oxidoreductase [Microbacterium caowuchunii]QEW00226.1 SDR family NAD(P)-dependent oxidoreductase [Microbacterium caowuchunii]
MPRRREPTPLPDLSGRTALVTGASDGVGLEIARALAGAGAEVLMPVRNRVKGERAMERIRRTVPRARLVLRDLDLARLSSVRSLAAGLVAEARPLDLVVLNAGMVLLGDPRRHVSEDGFELHFQTNVLGHVALLRAAAPLLREGSRVAVQCSIAAAVGRLRWDDLQSTRGYTAFRAYSASKLALGLWGFELARRTASSGVRVAVCHPGVSPGTEIAPRIRDRVPAGIRDPAIARLGNSPADAAGPALLALTTDAPTGAFFGPSGLLGISGPPTERRPFRRLRSAADAARIRDVMVRMLDG